MNGSRLGRGRSGRLAVYAGCGLVVLIMVFLYRAATSEMARLRELHIQCAHQQETLAAQLQVIFEYKVRLEKSLAEEKSSNAAVKQELQQRATREKTLRDKDSLEAMQRFNSLQQTYRLLQTEHQDLQEDCKKREKQALEDTNRLESTLRDLRTRIRQAKEDKEKALENLKTKILELDTQKTELEQKYNEMLKNNGNIDSTVEHLRKEVIQLKQELENAKKSLQKATSPSMRMPNPLQPEASQARSGAPGNAAQPSPSQQQQVSPPTSDDKNPLHAPQQVIDEPLQSNEQRANEVNNVRFAQKNGNIVPVGPNEVKEPDALPLPYELQEKRQRNANTAETKPGDKPRDQDELQGLLPPTNLPANEDYYNNEVPNDKIEKEKNATEPPKTPKAPVVEKRDTEKVDEKLDNAQNNVDGILNQIFRMV